MNKVDKTIGRLTPQHLEVFRNLGYCLEAAKFAIDVIAKCHEDKECGLVTARDFIREILFELEHRKKLEMEMWDRIKKEYNVSDEDFAKLEINPDNGDINVLNGTYKDGIDLRKFNLIWGQGLPDKSNTEVM